MGMEIREYRYLTLEKAHCFIFYFDNSDFTGKSERVQILESVNHIFNLESNSNVQIGSISRSYGSLNSVCMVRIFELGEDRNLFFWDSQSIGVKRLVGRGVRKTHKGI